jgi:hypothetical protein
MDLPPPVGNPQNAERQEAFRTWQVDPEPMLTGTNWAWRGWAWEGSPDSKVVGAREIKKRQRKGKDVPGEGGGVLKAKRQPGL